MQIEKILETVQGVIDGQVRYELIDQQEQTDGSNEFLFFIKPELLLDDDAIQTRTILEMIAEKIQSFGLNIRSTRVLSADYLEEHSLIAQHYGVINKIASDAKGQLSEGAKKKFFEIFGEPIERANVLGGLEFLKAYPDFSALAVDYLWQNSKFEKLAGGSYAQKLSLDGNACYLVNGFHGRQLQHFTQPGRCIIVCSLTSDLNWTDARGTFIGATCPADAKNGSIRKTLLNNASSYGLKAVTPSWNGVHLSAGPIEGMVESIRYLSQFDENQKLVLEDLTVGKRFVDALGSEKANELLANPVVDHRGESISVFDLTEEMDANDALELIPKVL